MASTGCDGSASALSAGRPWRRLSCGADKKGSSAAAGARPADAITRCGAADGPATAAGAERRAFEARPSRACLFRLLSEPAFTMAKGQAVGLEKGHVVSKRTLAARPGARKGVRRTPGHGRGCRLPLRLL